MARDDDVSLSSTGNHPRHTVGARLDRLGGLGHPFPTEHEIHPKDTTHTPLTPF